MTGVVTRVVDAHTGDLVTTLQGQIAPISAAFSADDRLVVTYGDDATVRIWDAVDGTLFQTLNPPDDAPVFAGAIFDDRAAAIVTWSDRFLRVYDCDVCGDLRTLERRAESRITRPLTRAERRRYGL